MGKAASLEVMPGKTNPQNRTSMLNERKKHTMPLVRERIEEIRRMFARRAHSGSDFTSQDVLMKPSREELKVITDEIKFMFARRSNVPRYFIDQDLVNNSSERLRVIREEIRWMFDCRNNFNRYFIDPDLVNNSPENSSELESSTTNPNINSEKEATGKEIQTLMEDVHKHDVALAEIIMVNKTHNQSIHNFRKRLDALDESHDLMAEILNFDENE